MGSCCSVNLRFEWYRLSLVASFLRENELMPFYHQCSSLLVDKGDTMHIRITEDSAFYIVVSGEVTVTLTRGTKSVVTTFTAGDTIMILPHLATKDGLLHAGKVSIKYTLHSVSGPGEVLAMDRPTLKVFIANRPHLAGLTALITDDLSSFLQLDGFKSLSLDDLHVIFVLLKLVRVRTGQVITLSAAEQAAQLANQEHLSPHGSTQQYDASQLHRLGELARAVVPDDCVGLLVTGSCAFLPDLSDLMATISAIAYEDDESLRDRSGGSRGRTAYVPSATLDATLASQAVFPGSIFGLEGFFIPNNPIEADSLVALKGSVVGYVDAEVLRGAMAMDGHLKRALKRNYHKRIMDGIREHVPLLSDLDEPLYHSLCSAITLHGFPTGDVIFTPGTASTTAYIILAGLVQEASLTSLQDDAGTRASAGVLSTLSNMLGRSAPSQDANNPQAPGVVYLGTGSLFGEVSLVTDTPYFSKATAIEPTVLVCISKSSLDLVYQQDKAKLAELHIRVAGHAVDLEDILAHPEANALFVSYCSKEVSVENICFYNRVTNYEDSYRRMETYLSSVPRDLWEKVIALNVSEDANNGVESVVTYQEEDTTGVEGIAMSSSRNSLGTRSPGRLPPDGKDEPQLQISDKSPTSPSSHNNSGHQLLPTSVPVSLSGLLVHNEVPSGHSLSISSHSHSSQRPEIDAHSALPSTFVAPTHLDPNASTLLYEIQSTLSQHFLQLKEVAAHIVEKHIQRGAPDEINISVTLRGQTLANHKEYMQRTTQSSVVHLLTHLIDLEQGRPDGGKNRLHGCDIFKAAKLDIFLLMKKDTFVRFKNSASFSLFLSRMKVYDHRHTVEMTTLNRRKSMGSLEGGSIESSSKHLSATSRSHHLNMYNTTSTTVSRSTDNKEIFAQDALIADSNVSPQPMHQPDEQRKSWLQAFQHNSSTVVPITGHV